MNQYTRPYTMLAVVLFILLAGCSNSVNPVLNGFQPELLTQNAESDTPVSSTHLWGYYTVYIDLENETVDAVLNRNIQFTANVTNIMNSNPFVMSFGINEIIPGPDYTDIDIDVALTHPFPGIPSYNGYDVRGVFMGDGSAQFESTGAVYPALDFDQVMVPDPDDGSNRPDGYTRWFNIAEFSETSMSLFSYTPGNMAAPGFDGTAAVCPYMYFADSLGTDEALFGFLDENPDLHGVFSSGATNERGYYIRFPDDKGVTYGYAVIANWEGTEEEYHPSNAVEAVACDVTDNSNVYYVDGDTNGGSLNLDISVFDWNSTLSAGQMDAYDIFIESTVTSIPYQLPDSEMIPVGGSENYSTYHVEITADDIIGVENNEFWILVQYPEYDYSNDLQMPNLVEDEPLTAYFRFPLDVSNSAENLDPICDLVAITEFPMEGWDVGVPVEFDASGSSDPDDDPLTFSWDFDSDGVYGDEYDGDDFNPTHWYTENYDGLAWVKVTDDNGGESECSVDVEVITRQSKNIPLIDGEQPYDIGADPVDGDLLVLYANGEIWKREVDGYYQDGSDTLFGDINSDWTYYPSAGLDWLDIAGDSNVIVTGTTNSGSNRQVFYYADGTPGVYVMLIGTHSTLQDACAFGADASDHANVLGSARGYDGYGSYYYQDIEWHYTPDDCSVHRNAFNLYFYQGLLGEELIYWPYIVACEAAKTGVYVWWLEDDEDFYASKWQLIGTATNDDMIYADQYFGTGAQTADDTCWWEAQDMCRDIDDRYFILDKLSDGSGRIKVFSTGNPGASLGGLDIPDDYSSDPLRIEGSDFDQELYGGYIFVMHGNDTDGYYLSVFLEMETPD